MVDEAVNEATTTTVAVAEAEKLVGPSVVEVQAQLKALEEKYAREVGDRDRGNARLAQEVKQLKGRLENTQKATDSLARRTFGVEEIPEGEYDQWRKAHNPPEETNEPPPEPKLTQAQLIATGQLRAIAEHYNLDATNPPADLKETLEEITNLYYSGDPQKAVTKWKEDLKKRDSELKAKAEAEAKVKKEEAEKKAKSGSRDTSTSTGGSQSSYEAIRDAYIKQPNDPATRRAYLEARQQRGV